MHSPPEWARARAGGQRIHARAGMAASHGEVAELGRRGLLGPDVTLSHCTRLSDSDFDAIAASSTAVRIDACERHGRRVRAHLRCSSSSTVASGPVWASATSGSRPAISSPRCGPCISVQHATVVRTQAGRQGRRPQSARHPRRHPLRHHRGCTGCRTLGHHRIADAGQARRRHRVAGRSSQHRPGQRPDRCRRVGHGHVERRLGLRRRHVAGRARRAHRRRGAGAEPGDRGPARMSPTAAGRLTDVGAAQP